MKTTHTIIFIVLVAVIGGFLIWKMRGGTVADSGQYAALATCIKDSGATFYGAFWCPHCQEQKKMFGSAADLLPYVECSLPNGQGQNQTCTDAGVESYPTWQFADDSRLNGTQSLATLAEKTSCALP